MRSKSSGPSPFCRLISLLLSTEERSQETRTEIKEWKKGEFIFPTSILEFHFGCVETNHHLLLKKSHWARRFDESELRNIMRHFIDQNCVIGNKNQQQINKLQGVFHLPILQYLITFIVNAYKLGFTRVIENFVYSYVKRYALFAFYWCCYFSKQVYASLECLINIH